MICGAHLDHLKHIVGYSMLQRLSEGWPAAEVAKFTPTQKFGRTNEMRVRVEEKAVPGHCPIQFL